MGYIFNLDDFDVEKMKSFTNIKIIESDNFVTIRQASLDAKEFSMMTAVIGEPGYGKTSALKHFAKNNRNVFFITVKKSMTAKVFYSKLLEIIGYKNRHTTNNIYHIIESIGYYLSQSANKNLLIIDEAGKLTHHELLYLHDLWDSVSSNTGVILAAPKYFENNITKMVDNGVQGIPELFRRIAAWIELPPPTNAEKKALLFEYGVINRGLLNSLSTNSKNITLSHIHNSMRVFGSKIKRISENNKQD